MTRSAESFRQETEFLSGVEANFEAAKGKQFRGSVWQLSRDDESDRLRALLASNRIFDREKLKSLPANRRIVLHGFERRFLFGKRATGVAIASVLSPLSHYASDDANEAPPIGLGELADHVRRLAGGPRVLNVIGVCSPTGFTPEAMDARLNAPNVTVVLIEPDDHGGWRTSSAGEDTDPRLLKIFDPEGSKDKVGRVRAFVDEHSADLLTGGLSVSSAARKTGLPEGIVRQGFQRAADDDPELRAAERDGEFLLFRGAPVPVQERKPMNMVDRIKQLFSSEGAEAEKVNVLAERRASLAQRRDRIYEDIGKLETKEADLFAQGKAATSSVPKRRLAAQLAQLRKDIARQNTTAAMLNKQIDIISTDIHNLTLIQQGEMASLPDTAELTDNAVRAEEMLETLNADADLVTNLGTGLEETLTSDEELAILKEFEGETVAPDSGAKVESPETAPVPRQAEAAPPERTTTPPQAAPSQAAPSQMPPSQATPPSRAAPEEESPRRDAEPT